MTIGPVRIERLTVTILSVPLDRVVAMSFGSLTARQTCLVEVDAGGLTGIGESWINYPAWAPRERVATLCEGIGPLLVGQDASDPEHVHRDLVARLLPLGRQWGAPGPIWQAISGIDLALWDLRGKVDDRRVADLLADGTPSPQVPAYASGVGPDSVTELCESSLELGLTAVKTKIGFGHDQDLATLRRAREVLGSGPRLLADANQAWSLAEAREMCELLDTHGVGWLEEPLAGDRLDELEELAAGTRVPLATGENVYGITELDRYVDSSAVSIIQPDVAKTGGLTVAREVARRAAQSGTQLAPHCYGGAVGIVASVHLATAFPAAHWVEFDVRDNPLRSDLITRPLQPESGALALPEGPGFGIELDPEIVSRYCVHTEEYRP